MLTNSRICPASKNSRICAYVLPLKILDFRVEFMCSAWCNIATKIAFLFWPGHKSEKKDRSVTGDSIFEINLSKYDAISMDPLSVSVSG